MPSALPSPLSLRRLLAVSLLLVCACGDGARKGRPLGSNCSADAECQEGACLAGTCLDPAGDADGDGLLNRVELGLGTSLFDSDSDDDGLLDPSEVDSAQAAVDSDGDGTHDALESDLGDADGDCIADQRDPDVTAPADVIARVCLQAGVCAAAGASLTITCGDALIKGAACVYAGVPGFETIEATCDERDNDCDGATDEDLSDQACGIIEPPEVVPVALTIVSARLLLEPGGVVAVGVRATLSDDSEVDASDDVAWSSDDPAVASVDDGSITAEGIGRTVVRARLAELEATVAIDIVPALLPFVIARTPVRALRPDARAATIVARPEIRAVRSDTTIGDGPTAPSTIVARPAVKVEHE